MIAKSQKQEVFEEDAWQGTKKLIGYRCKKCKRKFPLDILEVDHIKPVSKGGKDNPSNLQLLCPPCNKKKGITQKSDDIKKTNTQKKIVIKKKSNTNPWF
jgi:5-methylcytosine-specific restriction endonuclease McrA